MDESHSDKKNAGKNTGVFVVVVCLYPFGYPPFPYQNSARHKKTRKDKVEKRLPAS